jgi:hypothetical protein
MSFEITTAFVKQYSANVQFLCQQKGSRLRAAVRVEPQNAEHEFFDQIGATSARKRTTRHADTPLISTPHSRRRVTAIFYDWADLIDKADKVQTLIDPTNPYAQNAAWAMGRAMDDEIIAAANGTAYTGVDGSTSVALPTAQKVAAATSGLTLAKLLSAKEILDAAETDPDEPRFVACAAKQITTLLNTSEVKSADYNTIKALVKGEIDTFLGFKFIRTQRLGLVTTATRAVLAWAQSGLLLTIGQEPIGKISERDDKNYSTQVYYGMGIGATRMEEAKVVEIACVES